MNVNGSFLIPAIVVSLLFLLFNACSNTLSKEMGIGEHRYVETKSGLKYRIVMEGSGDPAQDGDHVMVFETTRYRDGTELYSNEGAGNAIKIELGANQVILGVEEGLHGMKAGEIKELIVPPHLAKRKFYPDNVSPDSILVIKLIVDEVLEGNQ